MPKAKESEHKICPHCQGTFRARGFIPHERACSQKITFVDPFSSITSSSQSLLGIALPFWSYCLAEMLGAGSTTAECSRDDFELAEWILESGINQGDIDTLLTMMTKRGGQVPSFRNHRELIDMWKKATHLHTSFESMTFTVPLKGEDYEFTVYHRGLWSWTLDILQDPLLAPYLNWDAQRLFKVDGSTSQRFYTEPHTGNIFWEIQTALPTDGKPICYIIYADKTWLSSFGTVQGYPVIVRLGNLPSHIRNGQGVGGGHVIGWLPIVKEEAKHKNKSYYADFKRAVWHKAFEFILSPIKDKSKFGAWVRVAGGTETTPCHLYLFPTIMILSANYEEQCMMALTQGCNTKFPCNEIKDRILKLGPSYSQEVDELLEAFPSWKDLYHFKQGFMNVTFTNGRKYEALSKQLIFIVHAIFMAANDHVGYILLRALRVYMELDVYASLTLHTSDSLRDGRARIPILASLIEEYEKAVHDKDEATRQAAINADKTPKEKKVKSWNFPKAHSHQHLFDNIEAKGVTLNYNTKPNESMHGSFKESYQRHTNFKNVDEQILRVDNWYNAMAYIRQQVNHHDDIEKESQDNQVADGETGAEDKDELVLASRSANSDADYTAAASLHGSRGKGGGKLSMAEVEAKAVDNSDFREFRKHLSTHMKKHFESHPEELPSDNGIPAEFAGFECQDQISSYGMVKVNYSSVIDWCFTTDILRCSPNFHNHPRYDFVLLKTNQGPMFAQLVLIFEFVVHGMTYPLMLVRPFSEAVGPITQKDRDLGFYQVRTEMKSNPLIVSIYSVIRGTLLIEDVTTSRTNNQGGRPVKDYLVVDMIDADMFLRMQKLSYVGKATHACHR
ncbi:hypothetical protein IW262DRAFT_1469507 [Armillaria fumosa]|nr:hypothetical protein IW262DRAFT_1469507 [Armillaria fumosa]